MFSYYTWQNNTAAESGTYMLIILTDSAPEYMVFYLWNVTNPLEIEEGGIPYVSEVTATSYCLIL